MCQVCVTHICVKCVSHTYVSSVCHTHYRSFLIAERLSRNELIHCIHHSSFRHTLTTCVTHVDNVCHTHWQCVSHTWHQCAHSAHTPHVYNNSGHVYTSICSQFLKPVDAPLPLKRAIYPLKRALQPVERALCPLKLVQKDPISFFIRTLDTSTRATLTPHLNPPPSFRNTWKLVHKETFFSDVGLFPMELGLFSVDIWLFSVEVGLFSVDIWLFWSDLCN